MHEYDQCNNKIHKHLNETQNLSKKLQIVTHPSTVQSARKIRTCNTNPWTTIQPVHSILTLTNLQLRGSLYSSYWPKGPQQEDSQCDGAHIAMPHPHQQQRFAPIRQRDQDHGFRWLQGIPAVCNPPRKLFSKLVEACLCHPEACSIWVPRLIIIIRFLLNIVDHILGPRWEDIIQRKVAVATPQSRLGTRYAFRVLATINDVKKLWIG